MVELNKCNLHSVTFCFPKTQSELNRFGPPTYVRSSLPEKCFTEVNEMAEGKTSVVCSQLIKHLYSLPVRDTSQICHKPPRSGGRSH